MQRPYASQRTLMAPALAAVIALVAAMLVFAPEASAVPTPPTGITAARAASGNDVAVSWTNPSTDFAGANLTSWTDATGGTSTSQCTSNMTTSTCTATVSRTANAWLSMNSTDGTTTSAESTPRILVPALPTTPTGLTLSAASGMLTAAWTASTSAGNPVTSYTAEAYTAASGGSAISVCTTTSTTCELLNLTNGTTYHVDIHATNADGNSDSLGTRVTGTPVAIPSAPQSVSGTGSSEAVTLTWSAPSTDGGSAITGYTASLYAAESGGSAIDSCAPTSLTSLRCTISGLTNGTRYYASVQATNANGAGLASTRVGVIAGSLPGSPTRVAASRVDGGIHVTWHAPASTGGSAITGYTAHAYASSSSTAAVVATCTSSSETACTMSGLNNDTTYYVSVFAATAVGEGNPSSRVTSPGVGVPTAPRSVVVERGNGFVRVSWQAPLSTGSSNIVDYTARAYSSATSTAVVAHCTVTTTICVIGPLPNGTDFFFDVVARNALYMSPASAPRISMIPAHQPTAPRAVTAYDEGEGLRVRWQVPVTDGGMPITHYEAVAWTSATGGSERGKCITEGDTCLIEGLNGAPVYIDVKAVTGAGSGTVSQPRIRVVLQAPVGAVQSISVAPRGRTATVGWFPPARTGTAPIASYVARIISAGQTVGTCTALPGKAAKDPVACQVAGLPKLTGQVTIEVDAIGSDGVDTTAKSDVPWTTGKPTFPRLVQALPGENTLTVAWLAPASDAGSPVTGYKVRAFDAADAPSPAATCTAKQVTGQLWQSCVLKGLQQFEPFYVDVSAANTSGSSAFTKPLVAEAQPAPPSAPQGVELFRSNAGIKVKWEQPLSNGGYAVKQYLAQAWSAETGGSVVASCLVDIVEPAKSKGKPSSKAQTALPQDSCEITGLKDGEYDYVDVTAINTVGDGTPSPRLGYTVLAQTT